MDPDDPEARRELAAALKHDLGKYVAWRSANLDDEAWTGAVTPLLVDCLRADVLRTREHGDDVQAAWDVWAAHTQALPRPLQDPELVEVDAAVQVLRSAADAIAGDDDAAIAAVRADVRDAQRRIRTALRDFHRRAMGR